MLEHMGGRWVGGERDTSLGRMDMTELEFETGNNVAHKFKVAAVLTPKELICMIENQKSAVQILDKSPEPRCILAVAYPVYRFERQDVRAVMTQYIPAVKLGASWGFKSEAMREWEHLLPVRGNICEAWYDITRDLIGAAVLCFEEVLDADALLPFGEDRSR